MSRYQKKHLPTHHRDHNPVFVSFFQLPRSIASSLFKLRAWQSFCTTSFHVLFGLPLGLKPSTSYSIHFFTQSVSSFRSTCPYHRSLFCCSINIMSSIPSLSLTPYLEVCLLREHYTSIWPFSSVLAYIDNRKKKLNSNTSSTCPHNVVNFGPLSAEICWRVWGTPANFNGFCVLAALLHARHSSSGHQPNFAALNRGHHLYSTGRPSRWALAHILVWTCSTKYAPLIIVCMKLYHLLLDSVMICVSVSQAFAF